MRFAKRGTPGFLPLKRRLRVEMTAAEIRLWSALRLRQCHGLKFRRQHGIGPHIVDFYCPDRALVIEVDGDTHAEDEHILKDRERDDYLQSLGICVVGYQNRDILTNIEGVIEDILRRVKEGSTSPHPSLQRRG